MRPTAPIALFAAAATLAAPALAAPRRAPPVAATITVSMADRAFVPQVIRLKAGRTYRLRFVNPDRTEHEFFAPDFFRATDMPPRDKAGIVDFRLRVPDHSARAIIVTPRIPAAYDIKSTKALDVASGMQGQILVY